MTEGSLLPPNATRWETAEELADASRYPLDSDVIRRTKDALLVDEPLLPLLAWERSVDPWYDGQSITAQRYVTDNSFLLHRKKSTPWGIKRHIELMGAEVVKFERPPLMAFPGRDMTSEERADWLGRFPQIRTFPFRNRGAVNGPVFLSDSLPVCFPSNADSPIAQFMVALDEYQYEGRHSYLFDPLDGSEIPLEVYERHVTEIDKSVSVYDWIVLPRETDERWFLDQAKAEYYLVDDDPVAERTVSVLRDTETATQSSEFFSSRVIAPGLDLIYIKPEPTFERYIKPEADWVPDLPTADMCLTFGEADLHVFDKLYLHAEGRGSPEPPEMRMWLDYSWFQFPAFTTRTKVRVEMTLPDFAFSQWLGGYWVDLDFSGYYRAIEGAAAASSARDRTLLDFQCWDAVRAGSRTLCGRHTCGSNVPL